MCVCIYIYIGVHASCSVGWLQARSCYLPIPHQLSFKEGMSVCSRLEGHLVRVNNRGEHAFISAMLKHY